MVWPLELLNRQFTDFFRIADGRADLDDLLRGHLGNRVIAINQVQRVQGTTIARLKSSTSFGDSLRLRRNRLMILIAGAACLIVEKANV